MCSHGTSAIFALPVAAIFSSAPECHVSSGGRAHCARHCAVDVVVQKSFRELTKTHAAGVAELRNPGADDKHALQAMRTSEMGTSTRRQHNAL